MLNLNCVICAELFTQSDDVHVTVCGHMFHFLCLSQWLERSKTCPQCRNKCSQKNIFRIYFNLANLDTSHIDVGSLQEQLDNGKLQLQMKENAIHKLEEQIKTLKDSQKKCMKTISGLEKEVQKKDFIIISYTEQIKLLKADASNTESLRQKYKALKEQITTMSDIAFLLTATKDETERLLETEKDPKKLCALVAALRRELRTCESKKADLRSVLRVVQSDFRKEIEVKKTLEERISELESENFQLTEKAKQLKAALSSSPSSSSSAQSILISPDNHNQKLTHRNPALDLEGVSKEKRFSISPRIKEQINMIEDSDSPYLKIKSSSIGLMPLFKRNDCKGLKKLELPNTTKLATIKISPKKNENNQHGSNKKTDNNRSSGNNDSDVDAYSDNNANRKRMLNSKMLQKSTSDLAEKLSIFKKPRLGNLKAYGSDASTSRTIGTNPNYTFDGFGGSKRIDLFAKHHSDKPNDVIIIDDSKSAVKK